MLGVLKWFGVFIAAAFLSSASSASEGGQTSTLNLPLTPCSVPDVQEKLRCGTYVVPEDRSKPDGRKLSIKVIVVPSRTPNPERRAIIYFEGGPGDPATNSASYVADLFIRDSHDVIISDQRGTGEGHRLACPLEGSDTDVQGYMKPTVAGYKQCAEELRTKADLTQYVTPIAMQDHDEIRAALGYDNVTVYGGSYGSRAAMMYARQYPQHVRSLYLSAAVPLSMKMPL